MIYKYFIYSTGPRGYTIQHAMIDLLASWVTHIANRASI